MELIIAIASVLGFFTYLSVEAYTTKRKKSNKKDSSISLTAAFQIETLKGENRSLKDRLEYQKACNKEKAEKICQLEEENNELSLDELCEHIIRECKSNRIIGGWRREYNTPEDPKSHMMYRAGGLTMNKSKRSKKTMHKGSTHYNAMHKFLMNP